MNRTAHKIRSSAAAGGIALLLSVAGFGLAPAALADNAPRPLSLSLSAPAPTEIGLAGQPVEYTDTVTNTGADATGELAMRFLLDGGLGLPSNAASLEYRAEGGSWRPVPLHYADAVFSGTLPGTFTLAPGASRSVHLRIGLPMGTAHHGDSNGGTDALKVRTTVSRPAGGAAAVKDDHTIEVGAPTSALRGVPASMTAGGAPATFGAELSNATASDYKNLSHVLVTNTFATVEVRRSGGWVKLTPETTDGYAVFALGGKDSSVGAHTDTVTEVRLAYDRNAGGTKTTVSDCVLVDAGANPLSGNAFCNRQISITVKSPATSTPSATPSSTPSATASSTPSGAPSGTPSATPTATASGAGPDTAAQLAKTGGDDSSTMAVGAAALLLAGGAVVTAATRRRGSRR
ncbi:LPXTG cell wall anchor domain-containing protein [Streptomyces sp. NPDC008139]|uniref:LPXTG cell wall anchor domain-containing protein n=1 Tax=Streptomyces sp. NPDC008139 TaxID=3364814 RepID=UPI0036EADBF9